MVLESIHSRNGGRVDRESEMAGAMVTEGGQKADGGQDAVEAMQERKHSEKLERLAAMNEVRLQESIARRSSMATAVDPRESVDLFLSKFSQKREAVESELSLASTGKIEASAMKEHLERLSLEVTAMEDSVAGASYFLPASIVKASQNTVLKLREELEAANADLVPKKKFSFRNKLKKPISAAASLFVEATEANVESSNTLSLGLRNHDSGGCVTSSRLRGEDSAVKNSGNESVSCQQPSQCSGCNDAQLIDGHFDTVFVRTAEELGGELTLSNLTNCKVYLRGRMTTLVVHSLKNCHVYAGPVTGSTFIEHVEKSVLMLASHQIRIHSTRNSDFYLRVRSKPIVEYATENRFAPYAFHYAAIVEDLQDANLAEETGLWEHVVDFRWLRAVPSPNWSIVPQDDRAPTVDGSNVVGRRCNE